MDPAARVVLVLLALVGLGACDPISLTVLGVGASQGVSHTLNGITCRTFTLPTQQVRGATASREGFATASGACMATKFHHGRIRRLAVDFRGDILEATLRLGEVARTRMEADAILVRLAFRALDKVIAEYCTKTDTRYPTCKSVEEYIDDQPSAGQAESNIINLPK